MLIFLPPIVPGATPPAFAMVAPRGWTINAARMRSAGVDVLPGLLLDLVLIRRGHRFLRLSIPELRAVWGSARAQFELTLRTNSFKSLMCSPLTLATQSASTKPASVPPSKISDTLRQYACLYASQALWPAMN